MVWRESLEGLSLAVVRSYLTGTARATQSWSPCRGDLGVSMLLQFDHVRSPEYCPPNACAPHIHIADGVWATPFSNPRR